MGVRRGELSMHAVIRGGEYMFGVNDVYAGDSVGYTQASLIDERHGSVHTGLTLNELAPGGEIRTHLHSFEEGFYVLDGTAMVTIGTRSIRVRSGRLRVGESGHPPFLVQHRRSVRAMAPDERAAAEADGA